MTIGLHTFNSFDVDHAAGNLTPEAKRLVNKAIETFISSPNKSTAFARSTELRIKAAELSVTVEGPKRRTARGIYGITVDEGMLKGSMDAKPSCRLRSKCGSTAV